MGSYNYLRCFKCGDQAGNLCTACQRPVCLTCKYRHQDCEEGR